MQMLLSLIIFVWCYVLISSQTKTNFKVTGFFLLFFNSRSMVPLLQVISRGSPMSFEDSSRIIPLFYLFSSLFSHSLISIHDNEFFGDPIEGKDFEKPVCCWPLGPSVFIDSRKVLSFLSLSVCVKRWKKETVENWIMFFSCRSKTIINDAFYFRRADNVVSMPSRCMPGDHQVGLSRNQARSSRRIYYSISEYWSYY